MSRENDRRRTGVIQLFGEVLRIPHGRGASPEQSRPDVKAMDGRGVRVISS